MQRYKARGKVQLHIFIIATFQDKTSGANLVKGLSGKHIQGGSNQFDFHRAVIVASSLSFPHGILQYQK